jgi:hypothetical protein
MEIFDNSKSLIENIYLLSGPILALIGLTAIIQLRLAKKTITISSRREAAKLATNQVEVYHNRIIPLLNEIFDAKQKEKVDSIKIDIGEFNRETIFGKLGIEKAKKLSLERMKIINPILQAINAMEGFSIYFTKGVADEEIAFSSVGRTFCFTVEDLYFDIAICIKKGEEDSFQNIIGLYKIWSSRLKKEKLDKDKEEILNKLSKIKAEKVDPIGTK